MDSSATTGSPAAAVTTSVPHDVIVTVAAHLVDAAVIAAFPILGNPITAEILDLVVGYVTSQIYAVIAQRETFSAIDLQTGNQAAAANQAATTLKQAQASGDVNAITQAKSQFTDAMGKLISFGA